MQNHSFLAFDIGASSGRGVVGTIRNNKLDIEEVCRFYNGMTKIHGHYYWDIFRLFDELKKGLGNTANISESIESIGIDTWGVDYGLLDRSGNILSIPFAYRDPRTDNIMDELFKVISKRKIYDLTGIQFMQFNTLFQLFAAKKQNLSIMDMAEELLFIPDLLNYLFTGIKKTEFTFATTSQLYNPVKGIWEKELFDAIGVSPSIMQDIVSPGTILGNITEDIALETGIKQLPLIAVASHDTGSAVAAIPAQNENFAYISSGTWSLMGMETKKPVINDIAFENQVTNEGGVNNTFRFLKNIMGLWLIQECKRIWEKNNHVYSYGELVKFALDEKPFMSLIDPDHRSFYNPLDMTQAITEYCEEKGSITPHNPGQYARCIFESLALKYRTVLDRLKEASGKKIEQLHIIGGGSQNELLCQFAANATGVKVVAGPIEATAIGNILVQAMAMGYVKDLGQIREIIRNSFEYKEYLPEDTEKWDQAYRRFSEMINS